MGEGPLTGAWPRLLALGGVLSSTREEESSGVGDSLRKRPQGRWEAEWEKQAREGEGGRPGELWCGAEPWRGVQSDPEGEPWRGRAPSRKVWR